MTSTFPPGRFGTLNIEGNQIKNFEELDYSYHCESPREGIPKMCARSLGINFENAKLAIEAGANILVSGTTIFKSNDGNIKKNIELLRSV